VEGGNEISKDSEESTQIALSRDRILVTVDYLTENKLSSTLSDQQKSIQIFFEEEISCSLSSTFGLFLALSGR
jgi:hypothetical protein